MKRFLSLLVVVAVPGPALADKTFNSGTGATWDCATDDEVTINTSNGKYTFKGACKDINVNGSGATISIESVEDLTVNGSKNTVNVGATDDINVNGNGNTVTWGKGLQGKTPDVNTLGTGNKVTAGAVATATTPTTTTATTTSAPAPIVLDCSKKKSAAITKSNGIYSVTGACDKVALSGSNNIVTIDSTKNLAVSGGNNTVTVAAVDKIAATGKNNTVTWTAGITGLAPKTASSGKNNTITQGGPPQSTGATNATTTTAAPTGAIDCGTQASHAIAANDGTYNYIGKCELITVDGNNNKVTLESAGGLAVNGNNNSVDVTAVGKLGVIGNDNTVRYKKGLTSAKPKISNVGTGNKLSILK